MKQHMTTLLKLYLLFYLSGCYTIQPTEFKKVKNLTRLERLTSFTDKQNRLFLVADLNEINEISFQPPDSSKCFLCNDWVLSGDSIIVSCRELDDLNSTFNNEYSLYSLDSSDITRMEADQLNFGITFFVLLPMVALMIYMPSFNIFY